MGNFDHDRHGPTRFARKQNDRSCVGLFTPDQDQAQRRPNLGLVLLGETGGSIQIVFEALDSELRVSTTLSLELCPMCDGTETFLKRDKLIDCHVRSHEEVLTIIWLLIEVPLLPDAGFVDIVK